MQRIFIVFKIYTDLKWRPILRLSEFVAINAE
ncbi:unnamed protein product [Nezara viridula]|uniref:Uncharacterized protein n=1 Tax=Nezara viridula TaxID=85310 RepID=A0A9P0MHE5_NEZVI|nr:unnamed protein product [Nezara viridula]